MSVGINIETDCTVAGVDEVGEGIVRWKPLRGKGGSSSGCSVGDGGSGSGSGGGGSGSGLSGSMRAPLAYNACVTRGCRRLCVFGCLCVGEDMCVCVCVFEKWWGSKGRGDVGRETPCPFDLHLKLGCCRRTTTVSRPSSARPTRTWPLLDTNPRPFHYSAASQIARANYVTRSHGV